MIQTIKMVEANDCVACVAAMATGTTLEEFKGEATRSENGMYHTKEFMLYLLKRGFCAGVPFRFAKAIKFKDNPGNFDIYSKLNIKSPALLGVWSKDQKGFHALYWDGEKIHDPDPAVSDKGFEDYEILMWYTINNLDDSSLFPSIIIPKPKKKTFAEKLL